MEELKIYWNFEDAETILSNSDAQLVFARSQLRTDEWTEVRFCLNPD